MTHWSFRCLSCILNKLAISLSHQGFDLISPQPPDLPFKVGRFSGSRGAGLNGQRKRMPAYSCLIPAPAYYSYSVLSLSASLWVWSILQLEKSEILKCSCLITRSTSGFHQPPLWKTLAQAPNKLLIFTSWVIESGVSGWICRVSSRGRGFKARSQK